jgi:hypothetical protein
MTCIFVLSAFPFTTFANSNGMPFFLLGAGRTAGVFNPRTATSRAPVSRCDGWKE